MFSRKWQVLAEKPSSDHGQGKFLLSQLLDGGNCQRHKQHGYCLFFPVMQKAVVALEKGSCRVSIMYLTKQETNQVSG